MENSSNNDLCGSFICLIRDIFESTFDKFKRPKPKSVIPTSAKCVDEQYIELLRKIVTEGKVAEYRNGERMSVFGHMLQLDLSKSFPLVAIKETKANDSIVDLLWMISGSSIVSDLDDLGINFNFWRKWAVSGTIGNVYGRAWRHAPNNGHSKHTDEVLLSPEYREGLPSGLTDEEVLNMARCKVDQLNDVIYGLKTNPYSSRHRISTYIPAWVANEALTPEENVKRDKGVMTPCASFLHFSVEKNDDGKDKLHLSVTQASSDVLIGLPVNLAQYAAFVHMVANEVGMDVGLLNYTLNDAHIYVNQVDKMNESRLLEREPSLTPVEFKIRKGVSLFDLSIGDITINGYKPKPFVNIPVSL